MSAAKTTKDTVVRPKDHDIGGIDSTPAARNETAADFWRRAMVINPRIKEAPISGRGYEIIGARSGKVACEVSASTETVADKSRKLAAGNPRFREVKHSGKGFMIVGAKP